MSLGILPLVIGQGAGAEMRRSLGTAVFSGMIGVTLFGIVLTPVFFVVVDWAGSAGRHNRHLRGIGRFFNHMISLGFARATTKWVGGKFKRVQVSR